jgi:hypothetical protein
MIAGSIGLIPILWSDVKTSMTTKKAVRMAEMLLETKIQHKKNLEKPENDWGTDVVSRLI